MSATLTVELHAHTCYSHDSLMTLQELAQACERSNVDCIAITDHNTIRGALAFQANFSWPRVIVGAEIKTAQGELIGYFLQQEIPSGFTITDTIKEIKRQGGLVCVPHPFDLRRGMEPKVLQQHLDQIDIIECFNGRSMSGAANDRALALARQYNKACCVGSDAHTTYEVGRCRVAIADFDTPQDFLTNLRTAKCLSRSLPIWKNFIFSSGRLIKELVMPYSCRSCGICTTRFAAGRRAVDSGRAARL